MVDNASRDPALARGSNNPRHRAKETANGPSLRRTRQTMCSLRIEGESDFRTGPPIEFWDSHRKAFAFLAEAKLREAHPPRDSGLQGREGKVAIMLPFHLRLQGCRTVTRTLSGPPSNTKTVLPPHNIAFCVTALTPMVGWMSRPTHPPARLLLCNYLHASLPASGTPMNMMVTGGILIVPAGLCCDLSHSICPCKSLPCPQKAMLTFVEERCSRSKKAI